MVIITKNPLKQFIDKNPIAAGPLLKWYDQAKRADWAKLADIQKEFATVDYVGDDLYVFNIGGNKYRLIVRIIFGARTIFVRFIGTHAQYDKVKLSDL